jgi:hypothetical protein
MIMKGKWSTRRGTTLIEGIVYFCLFGTVLSCVYWVLIASLRYYNIADSSVQLQQDALNATSDFTRELCESMAGSIYDENGSVPGSTTFSNSIIFVSPRKQDGTYSYDSNRNLMWCKWVCYYVDTTDSCLYKKEYYFTPTINPSRITSCDTTLEFKNTTNLPRRAVTRNLCSVVFSLASDASLKIVSNFDKSPSTDKGNSLSVETQLTFRNAPYSNR